HGDTHYSYRPSGNVDAGIVYRTDALVSKDKVRVIATAPAGSHKPVTYPAGVVTASGNKVVAQKFVLFLTGKGRQVFTKYGFSVAE
ncbi:MAG TPA: extracellular solute-binding protein, partial [Spirochaetota bacterium]|nr:extracellular solute-binding protein [Spirochaetota bacterium]